MTPDRYFDMFMECMFFMNNHTQSQQASNQVFNFKRYTMVANMMINQKQIQETMDAFKKSIKQQVIKQLIEHAQTMESIEHKTDLLNLLNDYVETTEGK